MNHIILLCTQIVKSSNLSAKCIENKNKDTEFS